MNTDFLTLSSPDLTFTVYDYGSSETIPIISKFSSLALSLISAIFTKLKF